MTSVARTRDDVRGAPQPVTGSARIASGRRLAHPGQQHGERVRPGRLEFAAQRRRVDVHPAFLDLDDADAAPGQLGPQPLDRVRQHVEHPEPPGQSGQPRRRARRPTGRPAARRSAGRRAAARPAAAPGRPGSPRRRARRGSRPPSPTRALGGVGVGQLPPGRQHAWPGAGRRRGEAGRPEHRLLHPTAEGHPLGLQARRDQGVVDPGPELGRRMPGAGEHLQDPVQDTCWRISRPRAETGAPRAAR